MRNERGDKKTEEKEKIKEKTEEKEEKDEKRRGRESSKKINGYNPNEKRKI